MIQPYFVTMDFCEIIEHHNNPAQQQCHKRYETLWSTFGGLLQPPRLYYLFSTEMSIKKVENQEIGYARRKIEYSGRNQNESYQAFESGETRELKVQTGQRVDRAKA